MLKIIIILLIPILAICETLNLNNKSKENILRIKNNQTVSLALGSGGARGYAHIGVIEVLEEKSYKDKSQLQVLQWVL